MIAQAEVKCSTPFGIKEGCAHPPAPYHRQAYLVLNAFRHQRGLRTRHGCKRRLRISAQRLSASKRAARYRRRGRTIRRTGAQRLSASKRAAPTNVRALACRLRCSTPFGIKEGCAYAGSHPLAPAACGAQRLSASKRAAPIPEQLHRRRRPGVLNAFRHQRGLRTLVWITSRSRLRPLAVLNAFRHQRGLRRPGLWLVVQRLSAKEGWQLIDGGSAQRLSASKRAAPPYAAVWIVDECSVSASKGPTIGRERDPVLNAFRHQRGLRSTSTPFGIEGCDQVLNAFRHQRGLRTLVWKASLWPTGAQRLSASKRAAHEQVGDKG